MKPLRNFNLCCTLFEKWSEYLCSALFFVCTTSTSFFWNNKKLVRLEVNVHTTSSSSFQQRFSTSHTDNTRGKCVHRSFKSSFEPISWLKVIKTTRSHHLTWRHRCCFKSSVHANFRVSGSELSFGCQVSVTVEKSFCGKLTLNCFLNHGAIMWRYHALKQLIYFDAHSHKCRDIVIIALLLCLFSMLGSDHIARQ